MDSRDEIILEVCEWLIDQVNMRVHMKITNWQRIRLVVLTAAFGVCLGGFLGSLLGTTLAGAMWGSIFGIFLGSAASVNLRIDKKRANEVIRNDLTPEQKLILADYVRIFSDGKRLVDTETILSAFSNDKDKESAIRRTVAIFFRKEMDYVVNFDMIGYPKTFYSDLL